MSEILITQEPSAPIEIDAIAGRVLTVTRPPEVYVPYIGANGHWWSLNPRFDGAFLNFYSRLRAGGG